MPALVDTTIRLLSQEPLAGRIPTADLLRLAELLDGAGFAYLEVSGGGVFDSAVRRGVESPWERIRALKARTKTPLGMALRGRFLVGSRPVSADFARRFVASAAESGIDVFRLEDPLNDVENLREAGEAIVAAEREFEGGLIYSPGQGGETKALVEQAKRLPDLGAARVLLHDPSGALEPYRANELVAALAEGSGLPVGLYCQGAAGSGLAAALEAARAGADLVACAVYPIALTLHRVSGEALASALSGAGMDSKVDIDILWQAAEIVDEHLGEGPVTPLAPRIAVRAAQHELPAGLVAAIDTRLRAHGAPDRLDDVLDELNVIREEAGSPPSPPRSARSSPLRRSSTSCPRRATRPWSTSCATCSRAASDVLRARSTRRSNGLCRSSPDRRTRSRSRSSWTTSGTRRRGSRPARRS